MESTKKDAGSVEESKEKEVVTLETGKPNKVSHAIVKLEKHYLNGPLHEKDSSYKAY